MHKIPTDIGPLHFIGIGGIGMSGIAELLIRSGYKVRGSDMADNANVKRLRELGAEIMIGHATENVGNAAAVIYSSAVKSDNPEMREARLRRIPLVRRAEMLAELMRLKKCVAVGGTHGKTTTTTMVATILDHAGLDPTVVNGGVINAYASNTRMGGGDWMVVEADESDGTFLKLPASVAVITNADPEHLDHYGGAEQMFDAFLQFASNVPFYGAAILCTDHPNVRHIAGKLTDKKFVTYGLNAQADVRAVNIRTEMTGVRYDIELSAPGASQKHMLSDVFLPMPGEHNVLNSLAAVAVARELGVENEKIIEAMARFGGVKRRFTETGSWNGVRVIDDYAHHPVEVSAVLKAARQVCAGKVFAVIQPHRYSRLHSLFEDFCGCLNDADTVLIADVYTAGEEPIPGADAPSLCDGVMRNGHKDARYLPSFSDLPAIIQSEAGPGDLVILAGAGSITKIAAELPDALKAMKAA